MELETINKLYLELSQVATAETAKERQLKTVLMTLMSAASLMRAAINERATFLTHSTDWERLNDAMKSVEKVIPPKNQSDDPRNQVGRNSRPG